MAFLTSFFPAHAVAASGAKRAGFFSTLALIFDTFNEAQALAREAHERYPFAEW